MKKILFDTYAIICFAAKEKNFEKVEKRIKAVERGKAEGMISGITLTELIYLVGKESEQKAFNLTALLEESKIKIIDCTKEIFIKAGNIKLKYRQKKLSTADSIIIATANTKKAAETISGDDEWKNIEEINLIEI